MGIPLRKIFYSGILIFWIVMMTGLWSRHFGFNREIKSVGYKAVIPVELYQEQWLGVYYRNEKIGYACRNIEKKDDGYRISELLRIKLNIMDSIKEVETMTDAYLDSGLSLKSFNLVLRSDANITIKGRVEDKALRVLIETPGAKSEKVIHLKDAPSLNLSIITEALKGGIKPGKKFSMLMIDPATLSQEKMTIEVTDREKITAMGIKQEAFKLKGSLKGADFFMWINDKGGILREESPLGFTLVRETKESAMQSASDGNMPSLDLIADVAVPFNMKLPPDINYLKVRLSGIDFKGLELEGGRQKFKSDVLEIKKEAISYQLSDNPPIPPLLKGGEGGLLEEYLKGTMFIQSKDPQIVSLAKEIVKDGKDRLKSARLIYEWIYKNIEKVPTITIPMATEVLKTKRGDCNEHTTLYVALARAAGIPAKIALGLTYKDGYFYYHAWPEIFIDRWIAIDPTLGQFPADAAHIRLLTGDIDKQMKMLSVIGKIKIEGLGYR